MDFREAKAEQERLAALVVRNDDSDINLQFVSGVDVAYLKDAAIGCAVVMDVKSRKIVREVCEEVEDVAPYIPGFFHLREGPVIEKLVRAISPRGPVLIDGNGILHPRRCGLASYIGVKMNLQTIGVTKKLLLGKIGNREGDIAPIVDKNETLGAAVWLKGKQKPIYVSIGHRVSLETAINVVQTISYTGYPEPLRRAHILSNEVLRKRE